MFSSTAAQTSARTYTGLPVAKAASAVVSRTRPPIMRRPSRRRPGGGRPSRGVRHSGDRGGRSCGERLWGRRPRHGGRGGHQTQRPPRLSELIGWRRTTVEVGEGGKGPVPQSAGGAGAGGGGAAPPARAHAGV